MKTNQHWLSSESEVGINNLCAHAHAGLLIVPIHQSNSQSFGQLSTYLGDIYPRCHVIETPKPCDCETIFSTTQPCLYESICKCMIYLNCYLNYYLN